MSGKPGKYKASYISNNTLMYASDKFDDNYINFSQQMNYKKYLNLLFDIQYLKSTSSPDSDYIKRYY